MKKIAIVTDSNSGITQKEGKEMGVHVLPMPFYINGEIFYEDITLSQEQFYQKLSEDADISTSQPSPGEVIDLWEKLLKDYEQVVHIPMSSGLSASCETATALAQEYEGRVQVVNNQRISVSQKQSVIDALALAEQGADAGQIRETLEREKMESSIYITLETLKYLKKGGRITPAAAAIGTVLKLKPVLQIQGEKLDAYAKCRSKKQARKTMLEAMKKDMQDRFAPYVREGCFALMVAYAGNEEEAQDWKKEVEGCFPGYPLMVDPLSLSVACHIGHGALAIAGAKIVDARLGQ